MSDSPGGIEALGTYSYAILDAVTTEDTKGIVQFGETILRCGIPAVSKKAVGLEQTRGADKFVRIPPERGATGGTTSAENALIQTIKVLTLFGRLKAFD